jgi:SAM-dependent methyltransferase
MAYAGALDLTFADLAQVYRSRFGDPKGTGSVPRLWYRLRHFVPDMVYEAAVAKLVGENTRWLDVGCGRGVFPSNPHLAQTLAKRCKLLVGIDPDGTIAENSLVHERAQCTIEQFHSRTRFDVVTLRMVAEHIARPEPAVASLARLTKPGGKLVIFTINRWSPVSIAAWAVPFKLHHPLKHALWRTEEKDTFPVAYQMNTRSRLRRLLGGQGFREVGFAYLSDCRTFYRFRPLHLVELLVWGTLQTFCLPYPENCLLGVYERY